jgi:hypothetical protein
MSQVRGHEWVAEMVWAGRTRVPFISGIISLLVISILELSHHG